MARVCFVLFSALLLFTCFCVGSGSVEEDNADVTEFVDETTFLVEVTETTLEEVTTTTTTTFVWWFEDSTTLTDVTETTVEEVPTTLAGKLVNGARCILDSECESGRCAGICCGVKQCAWGSKCYDAGQAREDGGVCQGSGTWRKALESLCAEDSDCLSGYCRNNYCCGRDQCGFGGVGVKKCYNVGEERFDGSLACARVLSNAGYVYEWRNAMGKSCSENKDCANGYCNKGYCCQETQCVYKGECINLEASTVDGIYICKSGGILLKRLKQSCGEDGDCESEHCANGLCCKKGECGYNGRCYASGDTSEPGLCSSGVWKEE